MKRCPHCGVEDMEEELLEDGICSECGEEFDAEDAQEEEREDSKEEA